LLRARHAWDNLLVGRNVSPAMRLSLAARTTIFLPALVALMAACGEAEQHTPAAGKPASVTHSASPKPSVSLADDSASKRIGDPACQDLKPVSVTGAGSGPTIYTYRYGSTTVTSVFPAPGFDPTHASNTELVKNGYPPRPTDARRLALWRQLVQGKIVGPGLCVNTTERAGVAPGPATR
jgi:hypothetical protein